MSLRLFYSVRVTIIRPCVIFGPGDDTIRNLTRSIKHLPFFPLITPNDGHLPIHAPVHVQDVARVVVEVSTHCFHVWCDITTIGNLLLNIDTRFSIMSHKKCHP